MYELPLMGHTLVTYCWGGKSQNSRRSLGTCLKATPLLSKQDFSLAAFWICDPVLQTQI